VLATFGASGELMGFFYPRLDYAQNVREAMVYVVIEGNGHRWQHWNFDHAMDRHQEYLPGSTILKTELHHGISGVHITVHDWVPLNTPFLFRRFDLENNSRDPVTVRLFHYFDLNLGEVAYRNAVRYLRGPSAIVQQWHEFCFAVAGDTFDEWQCGKASPDAFSNAKHAVERGSLSGQSLDIGDVNFSVGWTVHISPGEGAARHLCILPGKDEMDAVASLRRVRKKGFARCFDETLENQQECVSLAARSMRIGSLPADIGRAFRQAIQILPLLFDEQSGACLAAPEFDPCFVQSGGYGYCWPRDAAAAVLALAKVGQGAYAVPFFRWCCKSQSEEGYWHQRYWLSGDVGPSWCTPDTAIQIDQVGATVHAMTVYYQCLKGDTRADFFSHTWETIRRAADYLVSVVGESGLHGTAYDLWETFLGTFLYSNASVFAALKGASGIAVEHGKGEQSLRWSAVADSVKDACVSQFWDGHRFLRGRTETGEMDESADSSVLGGFVPFGMLDLEDPSERSMVESTLIAVRERLEVEVDGLHDASRGPGIRRHEHDSYAGGPPATVNTLWMAQALLTFAEWERASGVSGEGRAKVDLAVRYIRTALSRSTPCGLLPELMGGPDGAPYWAAPHAWCTGLLIECCLLLMRLDKK